MSYLIHIDPAVNCAFCKFWGPHDFSEMDQSTSDLIAHPDYKPGMNILRDFREQILPEDLSFKSLSEESMKQQQRHDQLLGRCRWAVLCRDGNMYAKVHQFIVTGRLANHSVERKPFRKLEDALVWLGVPRDYEPVYPE